MAHGKHVLVWVFVICLYATGDFATAQVLRVPFVDIDRSNGRIRVQAPFVDVYRGPGMTSVRAPFTNVVRPGYRNYGYGQPYFGQPYRSQISGQPFYYGLQHPQAERNGQQSANPRQPSTPPGYVAVPYPGRPGYFILRRAQPSQQGQRRNANRPATGPAQTPLPTGNDSGPRLLPPDVDPGLPAPPIAIEDIATNGPRLKPVPETNGVSAGLGQRRNESRQLQNSRPRNPHAISIELSETVPVIFDDESDDGFVVVRSRKSKSARSDIQQVAADLDAPPVLKVPSASSDDPKSATPETDDGEPKARHTMVIPVESHQRIPRMNVIVGGTVSRQSRGSKFYELMPIPHDELENHYQPHAGLHVFALIHPTTRQPFAVQIRLPDGEPTFDVRNNGIIMDFDGKQRTIIFAPDGGVIVTGQ